MRVNFDRNNQQFRCHFTDTNISAKKVCKVYYGPESLGCKSLPYYSEADISNSNLVGGGIRREIGNISKVCFSLEASDGSKTAFIEGIYDMDEGKLNKFLIQ